MLVYEYTNLLFDDQGQVDVVIPFWRDHAAIRIAYQAHIVVITLAVWATGAAFDFGVKTHRACTMKVDLPMTEYLDLLLPRDKLSRCIIASVCVFDQLLDSCVEIRF